MSAVAPGYEGNEDIPSLASSIVREKSPRKNQCLLFLKLEFLPMLGEIVFMYFPLKIMSSVP